MDTLTTIGDWIRWAASRFNEAKLHFGHGTDNAWDEAVQLVLQVLHLPVEADRCVFYAHVTETERQDLLDMISRRIHTRKPLPYLTKKAWFMGLPFYVDERVLIPRSPFGEWINKQFVPWINPDRVQRILEIGTGSGCMAIAAAFAFPDAQIDAVDLSEDALSVAGINVAEYHLEDRVHLIQSNCFSAIEPDGQYDLIISNPPYVSAEEMKTLPPEYHQEPKHALEADHEGLSVVDIILQQAAKYLAIDGILVVEVGNTADHLIRRFPKVSFTWLKQEHGESDSLFLLTREQLKEARNSPFL